MKTSWKHTTFKPNANELANMKATLPGYRNWYYVECLESNDPWDGPDDSDEILVKFYSPDGMQTVHGQTVYYDYSRIETFNFCDYADKPEPPSIESRLNIAEWQVAGLEKIIKELKDRLTKLENGV